MKLPINPFLYLVSLASLVGIGNSVYQQWKSQDSDARALVKQTAEKAAILKDLGERRQPPVETQRYQGDFWLNFSKANFTGYVEPEKGPELPVTETKPPVDPDLDIASLLEVICIAYGGDNTGAIVNYLKTVDVPPEMALTAAPPGGVPNSIPAGRRGRNNMPVIPTVTAGSAPAHHLALGDKLWPPYDYVVLKAVSPTAGNVTFEIQDDKRKTQDGKYPQAVVATSTMGLPEEIRKSLQKLSGASPAATTSVGQEASATSPDTTGAGGWRDPGEQNFVGTDRVDISRDRQLFLEQNGQVVFNEDVHLRDYSGSSGSSRIQGVQVGKISKRVQDFGVEAGDVLLAINGVEIKNMAHAKSVGRKQYNDGARSFRARILRRGQVIEKVYHFNDKK